MVLIFFNISTVFQILNMKDIRIQLYDMIWQYSNRNLVVILNHWGFTVLVHWIRWRHLGLLKMSYYSFRFFESPQLKKVGIRQNNWSSLTIIYHKILLWSDTEDKMGGNFCRKKGDKRKSCIRCEHKLRSINHREPLHYWSLFTKNDSLK